MANDLNQCNFIGRLGDDPTVRYMPNGTATCNFSIAVGWKTKEKEGCEWVNIATYEKLAEICGEYLRKGSQVMISGKLRTRKYDDKQGITRYMTEVVANNMQMLGSKQDGTQSSDRRASSADDYARAREGHEPARSSEDMNDDIPF